MTIRILLAEDHNVVRTAVAAYLARRGDIEVVGEVAEGGDALFSAVEELRPDVLLLDANMPGHEVDVIESARQLARLHAEMKILVLSAYKQREYVVGLLKAGASGYILKDDSPEMLLRAIRAVGNGSEWVSPRVSNLLIGSVRNGEKEPSALLSKREIDVFPCETGAVEHVSPQRRQSLEALVRPVQRQHRVELRQKFAQRRRARERKAKNRFRLSRRRLKQKLEKLVNLDFHRPSATINARLFGARKAIFCRKEKQDATSSRHPSIRRLPKGSRPPPLCARLRPF